MLEHLEQKPDDPILKLLAESRRDPSPFVVDLSAGVYKTENGDTPVPEAVKQAEQRRLLKEDSKVYQGICGDERFNSHVSELMLGGEHPALKDGRVSTVQTVGGSGALFLGARLLLAARPNTEIWAGNPTWGNHIPLLTSAGAVLNSFPYYDFENHCVDFDAMLSSIRALPEESVVLLHGCCHNPSGADLSLAQWQQLTEVVLDRNHIPFVDTAYQGMGTDLETDAQGMRLLAERVPEMLIAYSCSKNFGVYRERTGLLMAISRNSAQAAKTLSNMMSASRETYSMPPAHGAFLVAEVLDDAGLRQQWQAELASMCDRIGALRSKFVESTQAVSQDLHFEFVEQQFGMFSFLGITAEQAQQLRAEHSVYLLDSSRVNIAGLSARNMDYVSNALASVLL